MTQPNLIRVAVIASAHGVKGQVKVKCFTESPDTILTYPQLTNASGTRSFKLKKHGISKDLLIVSIEGVDDRNVSETLKGTELYAPAPMRKNTSSGQWTYSDLTGLTARLDNGKTYGKVIGVYNFGAGDIVELELADGKTEMLPFKDEFVGTVDLDKGYLTVIPPDYIESDEQP